MELGRRHWLLIVSTSLCWLTASGADHRDFSGTVGRIFDGDSFLIRPAQARDNKSDIDVRLQDIDAPEKDQPYGNNAPPWQYRYLRRKNKSTTNVLLLTGQRPWYSEGAQTAGFHQPVTPITASIVIPPGAVAGGEAGAGWPVVVPQPVEVTDHLQRQR